MEDLLIHLLNRLKSLEVRIAALEARWKMPSSATPDSPDPDGRFRQLEKRVAALEAHVS